MKDDEDGSFTLEPGDSIAIDPSEKVFRFPCPFCAAKVLVGHFILDGVSELGALHTLPMCEKFESLSPVEYMKACRLRRMD